MLWDKPGQLHDPVDEKIFKVHIGQNIGLLGKKRLKFVECYVIRG
jgi:hypothetical protein